MHASALFLWLAAFLMIGLVPWLGTLEAPVLQDPDELRDFRECTQIQLRLLETQDVAEIAALRDRFRELRTRLWRRLSRNSPVTPAATSAS
jgi:hypothetical protein